MIEILTDANKEHLDNGDIVTLFDYSYEGNEDVVIIGGITCKFMGRILLYNYPQFMRYDKFMEKKKSMKVARFVDKWGFIPYELMG